MLTILLIILLSMMVFSTLIVILASIAASRSSRWEEQYWEELALSNSKPEKVFVSDPVYQPAVTEVEEIREDEQIEEQMDVTGPKAAEHPVSKTHPSPPSSGFNRQPRSA